MWPPNTFPAVLASIGSVTSVYSDRDSRTGRACNAELLIPDPQNKTESLYLAQIFDARGEGQGLRIGVRPPLIKGSESPPVVLVENSHFAATDGNRLDFPGRLYNITGLEARKRFTYRKYRKFPLRLDQRHLQHQLQVEHHLQTAIDLKKGRD